MHHCTFFEVRASPGAARQSAKQTWLLLRHFTLVTPSTKTRSTIVLEAAAGILATNNPDIREVYTAEIVEMSTNCSETSLSMSDLFEVTSGNVGFILFIVIMTLLSFTTFLMYAEAYVYLNKKILASRRKVRLLIVLGIFPFISVCALLSLYMPRSHMITFFTSTMRNLKIIKSLVLQVTILRPLVLFIGLVTWADGTYVPGNLTFTSINLYVQLLSLCSTLVALWGVIMFVRVSKGPLAKYRVTPKFLIVQVCLITVSSQAIIIAIIGGFNGIPCTAVFRSLDRGNYINDMLLVIEMFLFSGVSRLVFRSQHGNTGTLLDDNLPNMESALPAETKKELEMMSNNNGNTNHNNNSVLTHGYSKEDEAEVSVVTDGKLQDIVALSSSDVRLNSRTVIHQSNI
ncbi:putative organic solute transporter subunit alpha-like [Apostichopus japonicus]|uniref:Putative organic solute transporter subunit alpha-like n=1 Tax=Stichopus japonicus TaxID=307972 RepID=A0A2G8LIH6_STIJA|nr:putative organic solute transporter subunit alpha-like [Apostichopus japonicus]